MHEEILSKNQETLLISLGNIFKDDFYLAGGTALALQIGHRESIDLDLFSNTQFNNESLLKSILSSGIQQNQINALIDQKDEYTIITHDTKITFLYYPFQITSTIPFKPNSIPLADELTIGAMKAYALGRRGKWKDYVDLFMLLQKFPLEKIIEKASEIFGTLFSEKLFREQLCFFEDIDFTEEVIWKNNPHPSKEDIQIFLMEKATKDTLQK